MDFCIKAQRLLLYSITTKNTTPENYYANHGYLCNRSPHNQFVLPGLFDNQCNYCVRYNCMGCPVGQVSDGHLYIGHCKSPVAILLGSKGLQKTDLDIGLPYSLFCLYAFRSRDSLLQKADFSCHQFYPGIYPSLSVSANLLGDGYQPAKENILK